MGRLTTRTRSSERRGWLLLRAGRSVRFRDKSTRVHPTFFYTPSAVCCRVATAGGLAFIRKPVCLQPEHGYRLRYRMHYEKALLPKPLAADGNDLERRGLFFRLWTGKNRVGREVSQVDAEKHCCYGED